MPEGSWELGTPLGLSPAPPVTCPAIDLPKDTYLGRKKKGSENAASCHRVRVYTGLGVTAHLHLACRVRLTSTTLGLSPDNLSLSKCLLARGLRWDDLKSARPNGFPGHRREQSRAYAMGT